MFPKIMHDEIIQFFINLQLSTKSCRSTSKTLLAAKCFRDRSYQMPNVNVQIQQRTTRICTTVPQTVFTRPCLRGSNALKQAVHQDHNDRLPYHVSGGMQVAGRFVDADRRRIKIRFTGKRCHPPSPHAQKRGGWVAYGKQNELVLDTLQMNCIECTSMQASNNYKPLPHKRMRQSTRQSVPLKQKEAVTC